MRSALNDGRLECRLGRGTLDMCLAALMKVYMDEFLIGKSQACNYCLIGTSEVSCLSTSSQLAAVIGISDHFQVVVLLSFLVTLKLPDLSSLSPKAKASRSRNTQIETPEEIPQSSRRRTGEHSREDRSRSSGWRTRSCSRRRSSRIAWRRWLSCC